MHARASNEQEWEPMASSSATLYPENAQRTSSQRAAEHPQLSSRMVGHRSTEGMADALRHIGNEITSLNVPDSKVRIITLSGGIVVAGEDGVESMVCGLHHVPALVKKKMFMLNLLKRCR
jgi:hypothetical protein